MSAARRLGAPCGLSERWQSPLRGWPSTCRNGEEQGLEAHRGPAGLASRAFLRAAWPFVKLQSMQDSHRAQPPAAEPPLAGNASRDGGGMRCPPSLNARPF